MKKLLQFIFPIFIICSCGASKDYVEWNNPDKAIADAIKKLNKNKNYEKSITALPVLYKTTTENHLAKIKASNAEKDFGRWDRIIKEYNQLQQIYNTIISSTAAFKLITPKSYAEEILETKYAAAADYYNAAIAIDQRNSMSNAKRAYTFFDKANKYVSNYKDAEKLKVEAFKNAIVRVVVNPVIDNSFRLNPSRTHGFGYDEPGEYFSENIVRRLNYENTNNRYVAEFYTYFEAKRESIRPDWVVDINLENIDIPYPRSTTTEIDRSESICIGKDTADKPIMKTVTAKVSITKKEIHSRAYMNIRIRDLRTNAIIGNRSVSGEHYWEHVYGSYSGDSRALTTSDESIINTSSSRPVYDSNIINELMKDVFSDVIYDIQRYVLW